MRRGEIWDVDFPPPVGRRPAVLLTRDVILTRLSNVTVAPITSTIRGIPTEVPVDERVGLDHDSVVSCDNVTTIPQHLCARRRGAVDAVVDAQISRAIILALDLQ